MTLRTVTPVVFAVVLVVLVGAAASFTGTASARERMARCPLAAVRLSLSTQGTATESVTNVIPAVPKRLTCRFSAHLLFAVQQHHHRAAIGGNPLRVGFDAILRGSQTPTGAWPNVWWKNWCGTRRGLRMTVRIGRRVIRSRFNVLPDCISPQQKSKLFLVAP